MDQWVGKKIRVVLTAGGAIIGTLLYFDFSGDIKIGTLVGTNRQPSEVYIPEKSWDLAYLVPDGAEFIAAPPQDDWSGEATSNKKIALVQ